MRRTIVLLAFACAATLVGGSARATATGSISAGDFDFSPRGSALPAGTIVTWRNDSGSDMHTVTAYYGASFASAAIGPGEQFQTTYQGGSVFYRCLYYSSLDASVSPPRCSGMCGSLQPSTPDRTAPSARITTRDGFIFNAGVRIDGTAIDNRAVAKVSVRYEPILFWETVVTADCAACGQISVAWSDNENPLTVEVLPKFPPGVYQVTATAVDEAGNTGDSTPITIYVV